MAIVFGLLVLFERQGMKILFKRKGREQTWQIVTVITSSPGVETVFFQESLYYIDKRSASMYGLSTWVDNKISYSNPPAKQVG
jgi:hypothetical protein